MLSSERGQSPVTIEKVGQLLDYKLVLVFLFFVFLIIELFQETLLKS